MKEEEDGEKQCKVRMEIEVETVACGGPLKNHEKDNTIGKFL